MYLSILNIVVYFRFCSFLPLIRVRANLSSVSYVKQTSAAAETGHGKQTKRAVRNHISFSDGYNYLGEKKKYKAHILKYVPCILKYVRPIFGHVPKQCKILYRFYAKSGDENPDF